MFVKRRPVPVNCALYDNDDVLDGRSFFRPTFEQKWMLDYSIFHRILKPEFGGIVEWNCVGLENESIRLRPANQFDMIHYYPIFLNRSNFEFSSLENVYFESSHTLYCYLGAVYKIPPGNDFLKTLPVHIVTRHQAQLEANAIFMGYVRRVLKKQIAKSDNLRVIMQCIESVLMG